MIKILKVMLIMSWLLIFILRPKLTDPIIKIFSCLSVALAVIFSVLNEMDFAVLLLCFLFTCYGSKIDTHELFKVFEEKDDDE